MSGKRLSWREMRAEHVEALVVWVVGTAVARDGTLWRDFRLILDTEESYFNERQQKLQIC